MEKNMLGVEGDQMFKKLGELSTLSDVEACAIVYGPYDPQLEVWPSPSDANHVLTRFKSMPQLDQMKKMMNQEGFVRQKIAKLHQKLRQQRSENREYEITDLMKLRVEGKGLQEVGTEEMTDLEWLIGVKLKDIHNRIEGFRKTTAAVPQMQMGNGVMDNEKVAFDTTMEAGQRQSSMKL